MPDVGEKLSFFCDNETCKQPLNLPLTQHLIEKSFFQARCPKCSTVMDIDILVADSPPSTQSSNPTASSSSSRTQQKKDNQQKLRDELNITSEKKELRDFEIEPGRIAGEYVEKVNTPFDAAMASVPDGWMNRFLGIMNLNRGNRAAERAAREFNRQESPTKVIETPAPISTSRSPRKRKVAHVVNDQEETVRKRVRAGYKVLPKTRLHSFSSVFTSDFTAREVVAFFAIIFFSALHHPKHKNDFWLDNDEVAYPFVTDVLSRGRFNELYSCFTCSEETVLHFEEDINKHNGKIWLEANVAVIDESLNPHKGRKNPHHVFIIRKPHPNGLKVWSHVDHSGFFVAIHLFRRGQAKETTDQTFMKMARYAEKSSLLVGDSLFGGVQTLEAAIEEGYEVLLSCTKTRPSALFKDHLCQDLKDGEVGTAWESIQGKDFMATTTNNKGKMVSTISTVFGDEKETVTVESLKSLDTAEKEAAREEESIVRSAVRQQYAKLMDLVNEGDGEILNALTKFRHMSWQQAQLFWLFTMLFIVNARRLYESATGKDQKSSSAWILALARDLHGVVKTCEMEKGGPKRACKACWSFFKKDRRTTLYCKACGAICKHCEASGNHQKFATTTHRETKSHFMYR